MTQIRVQYYNSNTEVEEYSVAAEVNQTAPLRETPLPYFVPCSAWCFCESSLERLLNVLFLSKRHGVVP